MSTGYDGREVANFVLDFCDQNGWTISNLALQKIVFFCHVWFLVENGAPLVRHEFEAWEFGPVLPYLYRAFRNFDSLPITNRAVALNAYTGAQTLVQYNFDENTCILLERVISFYARLRASELVNLSHVPNGPWDQTWNHRGASNPGMRISNSSIFDFYSRAPSNYAVQ